MTTTENEIFDTVIIGGGIAGLTAANELKKSNILVLEKEEKCGGRTLSYKYGDYIFNEQGQNAGNEIEWFVCLFPLISIDKRF